MIRHLIPHFILSTICLAADQVDLEKPFRIEVGGSPLTIDEGYAYPTFVDLNKDGKLDLVVGGYTNRGKMTYFKNKGSKAKFVFSKGEFLTFEDGETPLHVDGVR